MKNRLFSGVMIGVILSIYSWMLNTEVGLVSIFPDFFSIILALGLMSVAMRRELKHGQKREGPPLWKRGIEISLSSGLVFGIASATMVSVKLEISSGFLQLFGFGVAVISLVLIGFFSSWITQMLYAWGQDSEAG